MATIGEELARQGRIALLKARMRKAYRTAQSLGDRYSCGAALASYINADIARAQAEFNAAADECAKLDPACPAFRFKAV